MNGVCVTFLRKCFPFGSIHVSGRCLLVCKNKLLVGRGSYLCMCVCVCARSKKGEKNVSHKTSVFIVFSAFIHIIRITHTAAAADGYGAAGFRPGLVHLKTLLFFLCRQN